MKRYEMKIFLAESEDGGLVKYDDDELEAARADTDRLDWLEKNVQSMYTVFLPASKGGLIRGQHIGWLVGNEENHHSTVRGAIDAAKNRSKDLVRAMEQMPIAEDDDDGGVPDPDYFE